MPRKRYPPVPVSARKMSALSGPVAGPESSVTAAQRLTAALEWATPAVEWPVAALEWAVCSSEWMIHSTEWTSHSRECVIPALARARRSEECMERSEAGKNRSAQCDHSPTGWFSPTHDSARSPVHELGKAFEVGKERLSVYAEVVELTVKHLLHVCGDSHDDEIDANFR